VVRADEPELGTVVDVLTAKFSPDYRYRHDNGVTDFVPILAPAESVSAPAEFSGIPSRNPYLARWTNLYSTRSDVFTAYIALIDEDGNYVQRSQVTLDRSVCFGENRPADGVRRPILPAVLIRTDGSYSDDTK